MAKTYICVTTTKSRHEYFHPSSQSSLVPFCSRPTPTPSPCQPLIYFLSLYRCLFQNATSMESYNMFFLFFFFFFPLNIMLVRVIHFVACKLLIIFPGFVFPFYAFTNEIHLGFFSQFLAILNKISSKSPPMHTFWITSG